MAVINNRNKKGTKFYSKYHQGLYISVAGKGEPIVFLHGGPGSEHGFFLPHVLPLAQHFKLIFYDQRGCGKSEALKNNRSSMQEEVDALESLRKELGLEKINLFGESWGSMLALLYATSYPERVSKIFLTAAIGVNAEGFKTFGEELEKKLSQEDKANLADLEKEMTNGNSTIEDIFEILNKYYVYSEEALKRKKQTTINTHINETIGKDIMERYDVTKDLEKITNVPLLVAQGSHDILTPKLVQQLLVNYIPHAKLMEIEDCGHWTVVEKPNEVNKIATEFFSIGN